VCVCVCARARTQAPPAVEAEAAPLPVVATTQVSVAAAVLAVVNHFFILYTCCEVFVRSVRFVHMPAVFEPLAGFNSVCACAVPACNRM
jgi:hypothetical protein